MDTQNTPVTNDDDQAATPVDGAPMGDAPAADTAAPATDDAAMPAGDDATTEKPEGEAEAA